jgi:hypothetical protein
MNNYLKILIKKDLLKKILIYINVLKKIIDSIPDKKIKIFIKIIISNREIESNGKNLNELETEF